MTIDLHLAFGRVNGYKINPNQEFIAIGVSNTIGTVFSAYPATRSFSRSALKSKSGIRAPPAGIFTAVIVIVALYGLTPAFTWISTAGISTVIIHAILDLVAKPSQVYSF
jgi:solute carrier family 26 (sodium-independent sulfate anion transporter), member 11